MLYTVTEKHFGFDHAERGWYVTDETNNNVAGPYDWLWQARAYINSVS